MNKLQTFAENVDKQLQELVKDGTLSYSVSELITFSNLVNKLTHLSLTLAENVANTDAQEAKVNQVN